MDDPPSSLWPDSPGDCIWYGVDLSSTALYAEIIHTASWQWRDMYMVACKNFGPEELTECQQLAGQRCYVGPTGAWCIQWDMRIRAVCRDFFIRPIPETFDDFILWYLGHVLGHQWFSSQRQLCTNKQHIVVQWIVQLETERERVLSAAPASA